MLFPSEFLPQATRAAWFAHANTNNSVNNKIAARKLASHSHDAPVGNA